MKTFYIILFYSVPLIIGALVALVKMEKVVSWVDAFNAWIVEKRRKSAEKEGLINKYFVHPLLWGLAKIMEWSEQVENRFLRAGIRVTSYLYFIAVMLYLAFVATIIIAVIILILLALWILSLFLGGEEKAGPVTVVRVEERVGKINGRIGDGFRLYLQRGE